MEGVALSIKDWLFHIGPLGIGWLVAGALLWFVLTDRKKPDGTIQAYQDIIEGYHEAIVENTRAIEKLSTLIEERTRRPRY